MVDHGVRTKEQGCFFFPEIQGYDSENKKYSVETPIENKNILFIF